jgi:hypothetical protein
VQPLLEVGYGSPGLLELVGERRSRIVVHAHDQDSHPPSSGAIGDLMAPGYCGSSSRRVSMARAAHWCGHGCAARPPPGCGCRPE